MKKTASPLIVRPGQIRKENPNLEGYMIGHYKNQKHRKYFSGLNDYIKTAAKKVGGFFSAFLFREKTGNTRGDQLDLKQRSRRTGEIWCHASINLTFEGVYKATGNFSPVNKIGEGGFGTVYKAQLENGLTVAVKRAKIDRYDPNLSAEYRNEILALSRIEHLNLVRFYGYVEHGAERIIVVEYVNNGTLRDHLEGKQGNGLEIAQRLDIAIDVAHAITYLHTYTDPQIIHRDIKASNILITDKLRAKVADFGFARLGIEDPGATHISTQIKGTAGYLDPEYLKTYQLTEKSDVYSFGVLLVEIATGRHPIESKRSINERVTTRWAMKRLKDGEVVIAMDPRLRRSVGSIQAVEKVLKLAWQCLAPSRQSRPSMRKCAEVLWGIRKELRDDTAFTSFHSANLIEPRQRKNHQNSFGIEGSDSLMFVSL